MSKQPVIAIVDDDQAMGVAMGSLVRSLGYTALVYASAEDFLCASAGADPSCLITDVQMPGMGGIELQRQIVAAGRRFPIIFVTAFATEALRACVSEAGGYCVLEKPCSAGSIIECLQHALSASPVRSSH
jgi:FixJ family two-component response regulator